MLMGPPPPQKNVGQAAAPQIYEISFNDKEIRAFTPRSRNNKSIGEDTKSPRSLPGAATYRMT